MRKILSIILAAITALCFSGFSAHARDRGAVNAGIGVEIALGGTAAIVPDKNSPAPDKNRITLKNGEIGRFNITVSSAGEYGYTIRNVPDDRDLIFDESVYKLKIYADKEDDGLALTYVVTRGGYKYDSGTMCLVFENTSRDKPSPEPKKKHSDPPAEDVSTGDISRTQTAFLFIVTAAAGSLTVLIYLTGRKKKKS